MDRDLAEQVAASAVAEVSVSDVHKVIEVFVGNLARCTLCGDTGRFTVGREVEIEVAPYRKGQSTTMWLDEGTTGNCPRCGPPWKGRGAGDPEFVRWVCLHEDDRRVCERAQNTEDAAPTAHDGCGWMVCLPIPDRSHEG